LNFGMGAANSSRYCVDYIKMETWTPQRGRQEVDLRSSKRSEPRKRDHGRRGRSKHTRLGYVSAHASKKKKNPHEGGKPFQKEKYRTTGGKDASVGKGGKGLNLH